MAASSSITTFKYSPATLPIFEGENYDFWSIQMRTFFISEDLWDLVENSYESPQSQEEYSAWSEARKEKLKERTMKDAKALYYVQQAITKTIAPRIMAATKSKEAWEILKNEFQGSENQLLEQSFQTKMNMSKNKDGGNKKQNQGNQFQRGQSNRGHGRGGKRHTQRTARGISQSESRCKFCKNTNHGSKDCHFQKCTRSKNPNHLEKDCWFRIKDEANFSEKRESSNQQFYPYMNTQQEAQDTRYIDSRCSNHMTGKNSSFVSLDEGVKSKVKFGDVKVQNIEGKGTIAVQTKGAMEASTSSEVDFQILANSRIPLSVPSGDEVESAISRFTSSLQSDTGSEVGSLPLISSVDGLGKLQSVEGMTIRNDFELMDRAKPIQNLLKDVEMWNAFVNNKEVKECLRQQETEAIRSNNSQTEGICYSQQQSSGADNVVTYLSSNQQTDNNLSSQQWSSGANNVVRTPSIYPQTHNGFFSQQQSSAMEVSTSSEVDFQIPANSRIPLFVPSGDEVESAISGLTSFLQSDAGSEVGSLRLISSLEGLGKLQSVEGMTIQNAFELMDRAKPIQNLLRAVATNVEMWNAFLNNKEVQEFLRQLETGANNVVTNLSCNQQTDNNLSSQQRSSGANNVVRTPSINPQTHNGFFSQQQSSAQQESSMPNSWAKIFLTLIRLGKPIFMAFKFYWNYRGGGGGGDGCGRGRGGPGGGGGGPSAFYNYFVDEAAELKNEYPKVAFVLDIMLMLSVLLMRFYGIPF